MQDSAKDVLIDQLQKRITEKDELIEFLKPNSVINGVSHFLKYCLPPPELRQSSGYRAGNYKQLNKAISNVRTIIIKRIIEQ